MTRHQGYVSGRRKIAYSAGLIAVLAAGFIIGLTPASAQSPTTAYDGDYVGTMKLIYNPNDVRICSGGDGAKRRLASETAQLHSHTTLLSIET